MMNDRLQASGPSRQRSQYTVAKPFSKYPATAKNSLGPEPANRHPQDNTPAGNRQIGGLSQISVLGSA
jgi:hypothetical protein